jgi:hypothetical protein
MVNGKEVSQAEYDAMMAGQSDVSQSEEKTYMVNGKEVSQAEYDAMSAGSGSSN